ncbi:diguanylate cyclase [Fusobacteria bacterium ZRK30]|nr:diguanylate cyclase [Fusobacteria bacterium ZRK30]
MKRVNGRLGHSAGDEALKILTANSRKTDLIGRYGGGEIKSR